MDMHGFLLALTLILITAKLGGVLSTRLGLPSVFGQLLAGVLLGPSVFGFIHPSESLMATAELGAIVLMFVAGLETDLGQLRRVGVAASTSAFGGVILPFVVGVTFTRLWGFGLYTSLFIGTLLTATSVSISAQTLRELGALRTREGTTILGAAVVDDVLGLAVLSGVIAFGSGGSGLWSLLRMAIFIPVAIGIGFYVVPHLGAWAARLSNESAGLAMAIIIALAYAWSAESFGNVAAITGAYLAGIAVARTEVAKHAVEGATAIGNGLLIPIFFVGVGLQANVRQLGDGRSLLFVAILIVIAVATKIVGCGGGALVSGFTAPESLRVGVGMISRGEVALVVATVGRTAGLINDTIYAGAVAMALVTTLVAPLLLRLTYARATIRQETTASTDAVADADAGYDWEVAD